MSGLREELQAYRREKAEFVESARQTAALFILAGLDLTDALSATNVQKARITARLERLIERERQRGIRRHWSYDLNRHIALKQALDRLRGVEQQQRTVLGRPKQKRRPWAPLMKT